MATTPLWVSVFTLVVQAMIRLLQHLMQSARKGVAQRISGSNENSYYRL